LGIRNLWNWRPEEANYENCNTKNRSKGKEAEEDRQFPAEINLRDLP